MTQVNELVIKLEQGVILFIFFYFFIFKVATNETKKSLEAKNAHQMPIVYKRQNL